MRKLLFLLCFCCSQSGFAQSFNFPKLSALGSNVSTLVPANWKAIDTAYGDLNNDGLEDLVLVMEYNLPIIERRAYGDGDTELIEEFQKPRVLAIYFKNTLQKYVFALQNNNFMLRSKEGGAMGEPFKNLNIEENTLKIAFEGGSNWRWKLNYQFKYQHKDWVLVQANNTYYNASSGEMTDKDYDFTNRKITQTIGNLFNRDQANEKHEETLYFSQLRTLNNFKKPWTWEIKKDEFL